MKPRGETNEATIAAFIILMGLFIIIYLLLIPQSARDELLGPDSDNGTSSEGTSSIGAVLLNTVPGKLSPYTTNKFEHKLTPINLFSRLDTATDILSQSSSVRKNVFTDENQILKFTIDNYEEMETINLYFFVADHKGNLKITFNNNLIFSGSPKVSSQIVSIPKSALKKSNELIFSVDSPGWKFWSTNYYDLEDINIVKKSIEENRATQRTFTISQSEFDTLDGAKLDYFVYCNKDLDGTLKIFLNSQLLFSDVVFCSVDQPAQDISNGLLRSGSNTLRFEVDKGDYRIEQIILETDTETKSYPVFSFSVDDDIYDDVSNNNKDIMLRMNFPDSTKLKEASVTVNDKQFNFKTNDDNLIKDISAYLVRGENYIKIIPRNELEITNLKAYVKK
ncbi:hypothetical protein J4468_04980 [Candidatus Woesearchaeota archaeon]|nr:hypothetical protein [Candidatus Woesearchaeota archaeon]